MKRKTFNKELKETIKELALEQLRKVDDEYLRLKIDLGGEPKIESIPPRKGIYQFNDCELYIFEGHRDDVEKLVRELEYHFIRVIDCNKMLEDYDPFRCGWCK